MNELKPGWRRVKFGDVVSLGKERCVDPAGEGIERYVGLEHIEPGDLRVRSWGEVADGTTFTTRVRPGHVLFGKRRAYQRKVAVADFDAVCSGDIYVFESANPTKLLPELLPFLCQTDAFFEHAVGTSAGSLSPRTNWTSLAEYELALPPWEEQPRFAKVLRAANDQVDANRNLLVRAYTAMRAGLLDRLPPYNFPHELVPLESIVERFIDYRGRTPEKTQCGVPLVTAKTVRDGFLDFSSPEFIDANSYESWMTRGIPNEGDVLFTTEAPLGLVARAPAGRFALAQRIICLQAIPDLADGYLFWAMRSFGVQGEIKKRSTGTTVAGIKQSVLRRIYVPRPSCSKQKAIVEALDTLSHACDTAEARLQEIEQMYAALCNHLLAVV